MKSCLLVTFLLCILSSDCFAQKYFSKSYSWEISHHASTILQQDTLYYLSGRFANPDNFLVCSFIVSVNLNGENWVRQEFCGSYFENGAMDLLALNDNNFLLVSEGRNVETDSALSYYVLLQPNLQPINAWQLNSTNLRCATKTGENVLMGGWIDLPDNNGLYLYLTKKNPTTGFILLDTLYNFYFNTSNKLNWIQDIAATPDGGAYLLATVNYDNSDIALIKIDSLGNWLWHQVFDLNPTNWISCDVATSLFVGSSGNIFFSGRRIVPNVNTYAYVYKLNPDHSVAWINNEHFLESAASSVKELTTGEVVIAGSTYPYSMAPLVLLDAEIVKLDSSGNTLWKRRYGGNKPDYFYDLIVQNHDYSGKSGYVLCGRTESNTASGSGADAWLVRLNCMGLLTEPKADFLALPYPSMPQTIAFANQSQYVYPDSIDGGHYILDWGDGSPPLLCGQGFEPCSGSLPTHTYQSSGLYSVTLQAIVCNDTSTLTRAACIDFEPNPQAAFGHEILDYTVLFTNLSQNAYIGQGGYCIWDFGDGSPPVSEEHPVHTYPDNGNFTVSLTVVVCQSTSVYTGTIAIAKPVGISPENPLLGGAGVGSILVYPNPAQNTLTFALPEGQTPPSGDLGVTDGSGIAIKLLTLTGQTVLQTTLGASETHKTVSVAHLPVGVYVYVVENGGAVLVRGKVAVVR
ncbi:MAG: T9SS type A sorting domain-containing protein [Sphingobacteriales bacterium]|nr:MAG: T9SS type A sorting domain-containing protein [Sphingobacteriales bacterium]